MQNNKARNRAIEEYLNIIKADQKWTAIFGCGIADSSTGNISRLRTRLCKSEQPKTLDHRPEVANVSPY